MSTHSIPMIQCGYISDVKMWTADENVSSIRRRNAIKPEQSVFLFRKQPDANILFSSPMWAYLPFSPASLFLWNAGEYQKKKKKKLRYLLMPLTKKFLFSFLSIHYLLILCRSPCSALSQPLACEQSMLHSFGVLMRLCKLIYGEHYGRSLANVR